MSGRPVNPGTSYSVPTWATGTNYPAGANPWNGTATKVAPLTRRFDPNTRPPAQHFNYLLDQIFDADTAAQTYLQAFVNFIGSVSATNWPYMSDATTFISVDSRPIWNPLRQTWTVVAKDTSAQSRLWESRDDGRNWIQRDTNYYSPDIGCIGVRPSDGRIVLLQQASFAAYIDDGDVNSTSAAAPWGSSVRFRDCIHAFGFFFAPGGVVATGKYLAYSADGIAWGAAATSGTTMNAGRWSVAASPDIVVFFPLNDGSGGYGTWDGTESSGVPQMVGHTLPAGMSDIRCLAYSDTEGLFMAINGTVNNTVWASPDGLTWTQTGTLTGHANAVPDLVAIGSLWLARTSFLGATISYSQDNGATWKHLPLPAPELVDQTRSWASNGRQAMIVRDAGVGTMASQSAGDAF